MCCVLELTLRQGGLTSRAEEKPRKASSLSLAAGSVYLMPGAVQTYQHQRVLRSAAETLLQERAGKKKSFRSLLIFQSSLVTDTVVTFPGLTTDCCRTDFPDSRKCIRSINPSCFLVGWWQLLYLAVRVSMQQGLISALNKLEAIVIDC